MKTLDGKVVVVTGAGRGIGQAIAVGLAENGARVVVADYGVRADGTEPSASPAAETVATIRDSGGEAIAVNDTVTTMAGGSRIVTAAVSEWGRLDGVVCAAGIVRKVPFLKMTEDDFDLVVATHLKGHFTVIRSAFEQMVSQGTGGSVVGVSSGYIFGDGNQSSYRAAKAGVIGLIKSVALAGSEYGITANCIAPRADTRLTKASGINFDSPPESIAPAVVYLISDLARSVTGEIFSVSRGQIATWYDPTQKRAVRIGDEPTAHSIAESVPWLLEGAPVPVIPQDTAGTTEFVASQT